VRSTDNKGADVAVILFVLLLMAGVTISFLLGFLSGAWEMDELWRKELVERGIAEYDKHTGKWRWRDDEWVLDVEDLEQKKVEAW